MTAIVPTPSAPEVPIYPALGSANFNAEAYAYGSAMPGISTAIHDIGAAAETNATAANERAQIAVTQADLAMGYRNQAGASAATAIDKAAICVAAEAVVVPAASRAEDAARRAEEAAEQLGDGWIAKVNGKSPNELGEVDLMPEDLGMTAAQLEIYSTIVAATLAEPGGCYACDTTATSFALTLPAAPVQNATVRVLDVAGQFQARNLTIGRNGKKIMGIAEDMVCSTNFLSFGLVFIGDSWRIV